MQPSMRANHLGRVATRAIVLGLFAVSLFSVSGRLEAQEAAIEAVPGNEVSARLSGRIADRPIVIGYARNISPTRVMDYAKNLAARLKIGKSMQGTCLPGWQLVLSD